MAAASLCPLMGLSASFVFDSVFAMFLVCVYPPL